MFPTLECFIYFNIPRPKKQKELLVDYENMERYFFLGEKSKTLLLHASISVAKN